MLRRLLREPLLHFLLLGGLMFAVFGRGSSDAGATDRQIVVSGADIDRLAAAFSRTWHHRPPDRPSCRHRSTTISAGKCSTARRSNSGSIKTTASSVADCGKRWSSCSRTRFRRRKRRNCAYLQSHIDEFRLASLISFRQIFVSTRRGDAAEPDARRFLTRLAADTPGAADTPCCWARRSAERRSTGSPLCSVKTSLAGWRTPCRAVGGSAAVSLRALHLVLVTAVEPATTPPFEQVRAAVEREWFAERRSAAQGGAVRPCSPATG